MMSTILPDCMMPDGAEPCKGYQQLNAEVERLRAPHSKDCAFLLNGNKPGRWDCDCDASDLEREREANAKLREALIHIYEPAQNRECCMRAMKEDELDNHMVEIAFNATHDEPLHAAKCQCEQTNETDAPGVKRIACSQCAAKQDEGKE